MVGGIRRSNNGKKEAKKSCVGVIVHGGGVFVCIAVCVGHDTIQYIMLQHGILLQHGI